MSKFDVVLCKSYIVTIDAENEKLARWASEFFTGNSTDISSEKDRKKYKFSIDEIVCTVNESSEVKLTIA